MSCIDNTTRCSSPSLSQAASTRSWVNSCSSSSAGPAELLEQELTQDRVLAAWERLSEEHRVVLSMHDIEDYSLPELAQIMDVPVGTLKSRLHRARAKLKGLLATERYSTLDRV